MLKGIIFAILSIGLVTASLAQDDAERNYLYPVFPDGRGHGMSEPVIFNNDY